MVPYYKGAGTYEEYLQQKGYSDNIKSSVNINTLSTIASTYALNRTMKQGFSGVMEGQIGIMQGQKGIIYGQQLILESMDEICSDIKTNNIITAYGFEAINSSLSKGFHEIENNLKKLNNNIDLVRSELNWGFNALIARSEIQIMMLNDIKEALKIPDSQKQRVYHLENAASYIQKEVYEEGLENLLKAIEIEKVDSFAQYHTGILYLYQLETLDTKKATNYFLNAAKYYEKIDNNKEKAAESLYHAGIACYINNEIDNAIEYTKQALEKECDFYDAHYNYAKFLSSKGDSSGLKNLEMVIRKNKMYAIKAAVDGDFLKIDKKFNNLLENLQQEAKKQAETFYNKEIEKFFKNEIKKHEFINSNYKKEIYSIKSDIDIIKEKLTGYIDWIDFIEYLQVKYEKILELYNKDMLEIETESKNLSENFLSKYSNKIYKAMQKKNNAQIKKQELIKKIKEDSDSVINKLEGFDGIIVYPSIIILFLIFLFVFNFHWLISIIFSIPSGFIIFFIINSTFKKKTSEKIGEDISFLKWQHDNINEYKFYVEEIKKVSYNIDLFRDIPKSLLTEDVNNKIAYLLIYAANIDDISKYELLEIQNIFEKIDILLNIDKNKIDEITQEVNNFNTEYGSISNYLKSCNFKKELSEFIFYLVLIVVVSDGKISSKEKNFITEIKKILNISDLKEIEILKLAAKDDENNNNNKIPYDNSKDFEVEKAEYKASSVYEKKELDSLSKTGGSNKKWIFIGVALFVIFAIVSLLFLKSISTVDHIPKINPTATTNLIKATEEENSTLMIDAINNGADVNVLNKDGFTPLFTAYAINNNYLLKLIIDKGANVNLKNISGSTVLHYAASRGSLEIVKLLIQARADVNVKNTKGGTPLISATSKNSSNNIEIIKLLIQAGADVNAKNDSGVTALMLATFDNYIEIVKLLIQAGADVNVKNVGGNSALMLAQHKGYNEIANLLRQAGAR